MMLREAGVEGPSCPVGGALAGVDAVGRALSPHPSPLPKGEGETAKGNFEQQCRKKVYLAEALVRLSTEAGE